ncbi:MAG: hypothetical protein PHW82_08945 [Bacteroidales bacterium]|nr:hypothetical protein [Bacteroidales bacterium]
MKVKIGQNILDVAAQETGSVENAFDIAMANDLVLTDDLNTDLEITIPTLANNKKIRDVFQRKNISPASSDSESLAGIGYWGIEVDFEIQ